MVKRDNKNDHNNNTHKNIDMYGIISIIGKIERKKDDRFTYTYNIF